MTKILGIIVSFQLLTQASCQMHDITSMSRGNALAPNICNSVPCTVRTSREKGSAIKGFVVCNNLDLKTLDLLNGLTLGCYEPSSNRIPITLLNICICLSLSATCRVSIFLHVYRTYVQDYM